MRRSRGVARTHRAEVPLLQLRRRDAPRARPGLARAASPGIRRGETGAMRRAGAAGILHLTPCHLLATLAFDEKPLRCTGAGRSMAARSRRRYPSHDNQRPRHLGPGPARPAGTRAWRRRDAGIHAGRNLRHRQGDGAERARGDRRADRSRQHVSPVAAAGYGGHRRPRRPASLHGVDAPYPHRFGGLPGLQPGRAAQGARGRRDVRLTGQRRPDAADAGNLDADPAHARFRRRDGVRRMHAASCQPRRNGGVDGAVAALGATLAGGVRRRRQTACAVRHRPGRDARRPARGVARGPCRLGFDGYAIGGLSVGESKEEMLRVLAHVAPLLPRIAPAT